MARQIVISKKRRGPPPTGKGEPILVRIQPDQLAAIDAWASSQEHGPSRPEAIRRLVDIALKLLGKGTTAKHTSSRTAAKRSSEMAGKAIDRIGDKSAPLEEQERRKRRLIKGPSEFREIRRQKPKA